MSKKVKKVVLAYSGGLDTSVILRWLIRTYDCEVVAFCADIGQREELSGIRENALATGASDAVVLDLKEEFAREYIFPAFRANALYEGSYLLGTSLARPIIAKHQVEVAKETGADALTHGATGKGNDQVRFELAYHALAPGLTIIAPWREWSFGGRKELLKFAKEEGLEVPEIAQKDYSTDGNLLHISYEGGILEDPSREPDPEMFQWTADPEDAPDEPTVLEIEFEGGDPVAVNGERLSPAGLMARVNEIGAANGVGRVDMVENRFVGMKSRGVYETPGGTILRAAHSAVESITMDREVMLIRDSLVPRYSQLIYSGFWFSPEMRLLQAMMDEAQKNVWGKARLKVYKGGVWVLGRSSPRSLYSQDISTFEAEDVYDQADATGFIRLNALRLKLRVPEE